MSTKARPASIRILCIDDHTVVRQGLGALINLETDMTVVASAATGDEGIEQYRRHRPDVTLVDLQLPGMSGFDVMRQIRREDPHARLIVLTMYHGDEDVYRAIEAGASVYLLKNTLSDNLIQAIRDVYSGRTARPEEIVASLARRLKPTSLTSREDEVVQLLAKGMRNKEIGASLGIGENTVETHLKSIFAKLDVHDRTAALTAAIRRGIVRVE